MDFSKFRTTGDLSDITVIIEGEEFKLHKFPLYAKSDFFCKLAKNTSNESGRVELTDFPGGRAVFGLVADFCYNMKIETSKDNIVALRCAAELLQMSGTANLIEISDKFIQDTITSAKMSRSGNIVASMIKSCVSMSSLAESCGIIASCTDALVECWLKPATKFSSPTSVKKHEEDKSIKSLLAIPFDWFLKLFTTARDRRVRHSHLTELMIQYISYIIEQDETCQQKEKDKPGCDKESLKSPRYKTVKSALDTGHVIDSIVLEIPEDALYDDSVTMDWITKVLRVATNNGCACRRLLVKAAGEMMNRLSAEDLCIVSPSLLHDIVLETCSENSQAEKASNIVNTYMSEMVRKGVLTAETYKLLSTALPSDARTNQDHMYKILEYVLSSEKDNLNKDQKQELVDTIDFKLVTEETLQKALYSDVIPAVYVAEGALSLCSRLRTELESVKRISQKREEELKRQQKQHSSNSRSSYHNGMSRKDESLSLSDLDNLEPTKEKPTPIKMLSDSLNAKKDNSSMIGSRNKVSDSNSNSPYTFRSLADHEEDNLQSDDRFKYDNAFRNTDNARSKQRPIGYGSYRSAYSYSGRY